MIPYLAVRVISRKYTLVVRWNYEKKTIKTSEDRPVGMANGIPTGDRNVNFHGISVGIVANIQLI